MRFLYSLFLITLSIMACAHAQSRSIDAFAASQIEQSGAPGVAYATIDNGKIETGAHGKRLKGSDSPVLPDTPFLIGSISKSFTAMAIMQLVEAGRIELDAPVADYLDTFQNSPAGIITIRQLLSHTSGFSTLQGNDAQTLPHRNEDSLQSQVERIADWTPASPPGTQWRYSNANYIILGAIIEQVSGQDFASYIQSQILAPIGMNDSFLSDGKSHDNMAVGHQPWFWSKRRVDDTSTNRVMAPAGGVVATASDLALYLVVMMNGQDDVISAKSKAMMMRPANPVSPYYGLGWGIDPHSGLISHSGLTPGVETYAVFSPDTGKGAVILAYANSGMGFGTNERLFSEISARALGLDEPPTANIWGTRSLFLTFAALPLVFVTCIAVAWFGRSGLRAKSGAFGIFSLWFPLLVSLALAWICLWLIPQLFGVSMRTFRLYQPDFSLLLIATAATAILWAVFRLAVYYKPAATSRMEVDNTPPPPQT